MVEGSEGVEQDNRGDEEEGERARGRGRGREGRWWEEGGKGSRVDDGQRRDTLRFRSRYVPPTPLLLTMHLLAILSPAVNMARNAG